MSALARKPMFPTPVEDRSITCDLEVGVGLGAGVGDGVWQVGVPAVVEALAREQMWMTIAATVQATVEKQTE